MNKSRRGFLKGMGLVAASPLILKTALATGISTFDEDQIKVLTCNIRVALPEDETTGNGWKSRKDLCTRVIKKQQADIICLQEVLREQNEDLKKAMPNYFSFGFEGPEMDEFTEGYHGIAKNPVFFSTKRFELLSAGGFWLSETPLIAGSKSWNTARARNANWVRIRDKRSGYQYRVVNLHLDHIDQTARENQIKVVLQEAAQYQPGLRQILTGDFNAGANNKVYDLVKAAGWADSYTAVHGEEEPGFTVHEFEGEAYNKKGKGRKIDFIFSKGGFAAKSADIIKDNVNGRYPSDHYFVSGVLTVK